MAIYAVGDIQGCYTPLVTLLDKVNFDTSKDTLVCVGDLVNRGPQSLEVLRLLKSLKNQCVTVLGNHDIHLLSMYYGIRKPKKTDTLTPILEAHDRTDLCDWLRQQPLLHVNNKYNFIVCHAGIYPWWSVGQAITYADEIQQVLINEKKCVKFLTKLYGDMPNRWDDSLKKIQRQRFIVNAFTRMRFCSPKGNLNLSESGYVGKVRKNRQPWFNITNDGLKDYKVIFGHWSALGLLNTNHFLCLDTGYIWGGALTFAKISNDEPIKLFHTIKNN